MAGGDPLIEPISESACERDGLLARVIHTAHQRGHAEALSYLFSLDLTQLSIQVTLSTSLTCSSARC